MSEIARKFLVSMLAILYGQAGFAGVLVDTKGNPIPKFQKVWNQVEKVVGNCPISIQFEVKDGITSRFNPNQNKVILNDYANTHNQMTVLAHEISHLCLYSKTAGASNLEEFRFIDEGLANIVANKVSGNEKLYKKKATFIAKKVHEKDKINFERIQKWSSFFGKPPKSDYTAYLVGSSFIYFIESQFGKNKLESFFKSVGESRNLEKSVKSVFGVRANQLESEWIKHFNSMPNPPTPNITKLVPKNGATGVPTSTKEILVRFDVPMERRISVGTRCDDGICYKNAKWRDIYTLVFAVDGQLKSNHKYDLTIGTKKGGGLTSREGAEFPVMDWSFSTAKW